MLFFCKNYENESLNRILPNIAQLATLLYLTTRPISIQVEHLMLSTHIKKYCQLRTLPSLKQLTDGKGYIGFIIATRYMVK